jgi:hypothetical protein
MQCYIYLFLILYFVSQDCDLFVLVFYLAFKIVELKNSYNLSGTRRV